MTDEKRPEATEQPETHEPIIITPGSEEATALIRSNEGPPETLFLLPLAGRVFFPAMAGPLNVPPGEDLQIIEQAQSHRGFIGLLQVQPGKTRPYGLDSFHDTGVAARIARSIRMPDGSITVLLQAFDRFRIERLVRTEPPLIIAKVVYPHEVYLRDDEEQAMGKVLLVTIREYLGLAQYLPEELGVAVMNIEDPARLADFAAVNLGLSPPEQQEVLDLLEIKPRLKKMITFLTRQVDQLKLGQKIQQEIRDKVQQQQKEYFLREQLKSIRRELGEERDEKSLEQETFRQKIEAAQMPEHARERAEQELKRLSLLGPESAEYHVIRTYLEWLCDLPWSKESQDALDIGKAQKILDADHYGLDEVKDRIIEHLAVRKLSPGQKGSLLCLCGPPGTGKTSLGRSIARSMNRVFFRFSLGGMRDEAEIKGHRRTYIGAMPGKILQGLKTAGARNPVFMLDEVDKLGADYRGDPSSALLEVLDPAQNHAFLDHYLDVPFDLANVFFIATANYMDHIPPPLLDRMEVIEISSYLPEEKIPIATRHLLPKQLAAHGLTTKQLRLRREAIPKIIDGYTREAGVRQLEREIAKLCRKAAANLARKRAKPPIEITRAKLQDYLGTPRFDRELDTRIRQPGVVIGLAWTPVGGDIMFIEASDMPGRGGVKLTGKLGEVMSESAQIALSYVRAHAADYEIDDQTFTERDLHIHFPAGAVPKDGPSAGVTIATALVSLLSRQRRGRKVKPKLAMTGEITLRGEVLPVGGIREKVIAAKRHGIKTLILPQDNERDFKDIPVHLRRGLKVHFAKTYDQVAVIALEKS